MGQAVRSISAPQLMPSMMMAAINTPTVARYLPAGAWPRIQALWARDQVNASMHRKDCGAVS